jgi:hypothetical protein
MLRKGNLTRATTLLSELRIDLLRAHARRRIPTRTSGCRLRNQPAPSKWHVTNPNYQRRGGNGSSHRAGKHRPLKAIICPKWSPDVEKSKAVLPLAARSTVSAAHRQSQQATFEHDGLAIPRDCTRGHGGWAVSLVDVAPTHGFIRSSSSTPNQLARTVDSTTAHYA